MNSPFGNSPRSIVFILAFLALFGFLLWQEAKADTPPSSTTIVEFGPSILSADQTDATVGLVSVRFDGKYDLGLVLVGNQNCRCSGQLVPIPVNAAVRAMRVVQWKRLEAGLGVAYWSKTSRALGQRQTFELMLGYHFTPRLSAKIHHFSNAGQASPNLGQDMVTVSWAFR